MLQAPPGTCKDDQGKVWSDYAISEPDWETIREMAGIMWPVAQLVTMLQGEIYVTSSLVLPFLGSVIAQLQDDQSVRLQDERSDGDMYIIPAEKLENHTYHAREVLRSELHRRFFVDIRQKDLIKVGIAAFLDIR